MVERHYSEVSQQIPLKILLVEDDAEIATLTALVLETSGHHTVTCANGEEALALLRNGSNFSPNVVITDYNLGSGINGGALLREIKTSLPNVWGGICTGSPEQVTEVDRNVADFVIVKPFDISDLEQQTENAIMAQTGLRATV